MKNKEVIICIFVVSVLILTPALLAIYYAPVPEYGRSITIQNVQDSVIEDIEVPIQNSKDFCGECINVHATINNNSCVVSLSDNTLWIITDLQLGNNTGYISFQDKSYLLRGKGRR